jgi:Domain of unknown function (DUF4417)
VLEALSAFFSGVHALRIPVYDSGVQQTGRLSVCFCSIAPGRPNAVCPYKDDFEEWLEDTKGLRFDDLPPFSQPELCLPWYIPVIDHRSCRAAPLVWPVVSLNTYNVLRVRRGSQEAYQACSNDPRGLREAFLLDADTQIVLRGIAADPPLERYWEYRLSADAPQQLARLDIHAAIGPNFSYFLDLPRTDHLFNRRRHLLCLNELRLAGLTAIPHLSAVIPGDWHFWRSFLEVNSSIHVVALEFQTGNKNPTEGRKAIDHLTAVQTVIGRRLHPIAVGGAQFVEYLAPRFERFTVLDSAPFAKAIHRYRFDLSAGTQPWRQRSTVFSQPLDDYLSENIKGYSAWIEWRIHHARAHTSLID